MNITAWVAMAGAALALVSYSLDFAVLFVCCLKRSINREHVHLQMCPSSTISCMLPATLLLISLMSGWSSSVSLASRISLQAAENLDISLAGLGSWVGLRVMKQKEP